MKTPDWPRYRSHKIVQATPIVKISELERSGIGPTRVLWIQPDPAGPLQSFNPTVSAMADKAEVGDYAVFYISADGYSSVSPKKEFDDGYTRE